MKIKSFNPETIMNQKVEIELTVSELVSLYVMKKIIRNSYDITSYLLHNEERVNDVLSPSDIEWLTRNSVSEGLFNDIETVVKTVLSK